MTINGRPRGLYYVKEGYDAAFLEHFDSSDGNFYDGGFLRDIDQPLDLIRTKKDVADRADLGFVAAAREPDRAKHFQKLEQLLDLDAFISYVVVEAIAWNWDVPVQVQQLPRLSPPPEEQDHVHSVRDGPDVLGRHRPVLPDFGGMVARDRSIRPRAASAHIARAKEIMAKVSRPVIHQRLDHSRSNQPGSARSIRTRAATTRTRSIGSRGHQAVREKS